MRAVSSDDSRDEICGTDTGVSFGRQSDWTLETNSSWRGNRIAADIKEAVEIRSTALSPSGVDSDIDDGDPFIGSCCFENPSCSNDSGCFVVAISDVVEIWDDDVNVTVSLSELCNFSVVGNNELVRALALHGDDSLTQGADDDDNDGDDNDNNKDVGDGRGSCEV